MKLGTHMPDGERRKPVDIEVCRSKVKVTLSIHMFATRLLHLWCVTDFFIILKLFTNFQKHANSIVYAQNVKKRGIFSIEKKLWGFHAFFFLMKITLECNIKKQKNYKKGIPYLSGIFSKLCSNKKKVTGFKAYPCPNIHIPLANWTLPYYSKSFFFLNLMSKIRGAN